MKQETSSSAVSASLNGVRNSPRKMRLIANLIRNKEIQNAIDLLTYSQKRKVSFIFKKLLLSLLSNWKKKNDQSENEKFLYIKEIRVNQGKTLKRLRPVPQGRGHRIRKRSSNIIVVLGQK
ncbi:50S ribosomal protein L22 [Blattabacterium sp. (Blaberus giganteus)]|uniref:50S ribosomal protein L22 n=1 Tax=Blattabacterium sp. (Blaberus giganteus) TaxID=1186051 RepID=UPI00025F6F88|nr:50S ribosomal protein L22 [Blattabacterium sp. (Blaberus giganteus)]AFJ90823.1 50S ribosomal protein L22 [Blattabacterium sp. (Blaberus giganteus)]